MRLARPQMRAFTIVELLAVIMIMAILMAVAMKALKVDPTQAACSQIAAQLRMARDHAIAKRKYVEVAVYRDSNKYMAMTTYQGDALSGDNLSLSVVPSAAVSYIPSSAWVGASTGQAIRVMFKPNGSLAYDGYKSSTTTSINSRSEIEAITTTASTSLSIGASGVEGAKTLKLNKFTGKASFW